MEVFFGTGMSDDSFNGLPVDSSWYSTYMDQGLVGDVIIGLVLALLLVMALLSPRGPTRGCRALSHCLLHRRLVYRERTR